jgi:membrane protein implicated in regulation of membrane protease activity
MGVFLVFLVAACLLGFGEMHNGGFFLGPFAIGALIAALLSIAGVGVLGSVIAFLAISIAALAMLRPLALRHRRLPPAMRSGAAALIGRDAVVIERIANREGVGCVKIGGEVWTARSYDDDEVIPPGEQVQVVEIRGATALVMH